MKYDISISPHFIHAMWINILLRAVHCIRIQLRVYCNVHFYTKCAVLNPFVQFLKHKCAVTKLTKIALIKQSSHLLITLVDAPENSRNVVIN